MPLYRLLNIETEEVVEELVSWATLQSILESNPNLKLLPAAPAIVSGVSGRMRPDEGFRDRLRDIKKSHPGSTIDI